MIELFLLIEIGKRIGTFPTLILIIGTGILGAWLVRLQGLSVLRKVQRETAAGRMPAGALIDGILILLAGAVLMTPGVLTDAFGFLCLVPAFRDQFKLRLRARFEKAFLSGATTYTVNYGSSENRPTREERVKDVTPESPEDR